MREIDLRSPEGNAWSLMGVARSWAKQLEWSKEAIEKMIDDMMSSDYQHLCEVFEQKFGHLCQLVNKPWEGYDDDEDE